MNGDGDKPIHAVRRSEDAADEEHERGADSGGSREVRRLVDPQRPCQKDVDAHELTHLPFRNWCRHCVRGRGKEMAHQRQASHKEMLHDFSLDYCSPGDTGRSLRFFPNLETPSAKAGVRFAAANGGGMGNFGTKLITFVPRDFSARA